jgi:hypothetical protein
MTRRTNARVAGVAFLAYIVFGISMMVLLRPTGGTDLAERFANIARHVTLMRIGVVLSLLMGFSALVLGVTMHAITRDEDADLAMFGLVCRVCEGMIGVFPLTTLGLLWLATLPEGTSAPDPASARAIGAFLLRMGGWEAGTAGTVFAVGSTAFSWLLLRGRMIPAALAWLGVIASVLLVLALPLKTAGFLPASVVQWLWIPMAAFEIPLALWLIVKGVAPPARLRPA